MKWIVLLLLVPMASAQMPQWMIEGEMVDVPSAPVLPGDRFDVGVMIRVECQMPGQVVQQPPMVTINLEAPPNWAPIDGIEWQPEGGCPEPLEREFRINLTMPDGAIAMESQMFIVGLDGHGDGRTQATADRYKTSFIVQPAFTGDVVITADRYQSAGGYPAITYHVVNNANGQVALRPVGGSASFDFTGNGILMDPFTSKDYTVPWRDQPFESGLVQIDWQGWYAFDDTQLAGPVQTTEVILTREDAPALEVPAIGLIVPLLAALALRRR